MQNENSFVRKILVPTDFSDTANQAVRYAARMAEKLSAKLFLFNVNESSLMINSDEALSLDYKIIENEIRQSLNALALTLKKNFTLPEIEIRSNVGFFIPEIEEEVKKENIDLVIMGTTGASVLKQFFFGTHAVSVID